MELVLTGGFLEQSRKLWESSLHSLHLVVLIDFGIWGSLKNPLETLGSTLQTALPRISRQASQINKIFSSILSEGSSVIMSVEGGLLSEDSEVIRKALGTAKGKVTNKINYLQNLLLKDDGKFLFDQIDRKKVQDQFSILEESFEIFQDLHQRHCQFRKVEKDDDEERKLLVKEDSYSK